MNQFNAETFEQHTIRETITYYHGTDKRTKIAIPYVTSMNVKITKSRFYENYEYVNFLMIHPCVIEIKCSILIRVSTGITSSGTRIERYMIKDASITWMQTRLKIYDNQTSE